MELVDNDNEVISGTTENGNFIKTLVVEENLLTIKSPRTPPSNEIVICDNYQGGEKDDELLTSQMTTSHKLAKSYSEHMKIAEETAPSQAQVSSTDKRRFGYLRPTISSQVKTRMERRGRAPNDQEPMTHLQTSSRAVAAYKDRSHSLSTEKAASVTKRGAKTIDSSAANRFQTPKNCR